MAWRSPGVPHVIAYWWKSPSSARWAASTTAGGGAKFGMPWARLTPPYWLTTRVISRMTDSVNPWTRSEIRTRVGSAPSRDGGYDRDLVTVLERGRPVVHEPDVFLVDVDVHEAPQLARLVHESLAEAGELALEVRDELVDRIAFGLHVGVAFGHAPQPTRDAHRHLHE